MLSRRSRTPLLLQFEAAECGAAALGIVLRHHGRWVPLEELRTVCGVSRDGTNALNLVRAAAHYGLHAEGLRRTTLTGLRALPLPAILFVRGDPDPDAPALPADRPGNHFVVLEALTADRALINDPAAGHRVLTPEALLTYSAGVAITCQPRPDFVRAGQPFRWRAVLADWLAGQRGAVLRVLAISAGLLIPGLLLPLLLQIFVDRVLIGAGGADALTAVLAGLLLALLLRMGLLWLHGRALLHLETTLTLTSSERVFAHLLRLPLPFFLNRYAGDLALRLQLSERVSRVLARDAAGTLLNLILMIAYAALLWAYSPLLAVIGLAAVALTFLLLRRIDAQRGDHMQRLQQQRAQERAAALDGLAALESLQAAGLEGVLFNRWAGLNAAAAVTEQQVSHLTERAYALLPLILAVSTTLVLTGGAALVMRGDLTIGMLVAAQSLLAGFTAPVSQLAAAAAQIPQLETDLHRLDDLLRCPPRPLPAPVDDTPLLRARDGQLDVYGLTFGYAPLQPPLLNAVRFSVAPGTLAVIHAPSGAGKSTLARLIAGLLTPWAGEIYLSGTPLSVQRGRISYADQTITLLPGTFLDNLRLYNTDLPITAIVQAAQDAGIHEFILAHGGYQGRVHENGRGLSGGQRQCLELARALARNPALLILDETTSALDPDTEAAVLERLRRRGCTTLLISHRASVLAAADQVITL